MKKRSVYFKKGIGILLMILGIIFIFSFSKKNFTGAVIGVSNIYYFGLIGFLMFLVGAFLSLEDIISGFKKKREEHRKNLFGHRLNMGRVFEPVVYAFGGENYTREGMREELKKIKTYSYHRKNKEFKKGVITQGLFSPSLLFLPSRYKFMPGVKPATYTHELVHSLGHAGLVSNDYVMANSIGTYVKMVKKYEETEYIQSQRDQVLSGELNIRNRENLRPLTKREKYKGGKLEYDEKLGFRRTGNSLGYEAAHIETLSKKTGSGLYFIKLVSEGYSPEKARDMVLGDYKPLKEFQGKYGRRWKRVLEYK